MSKETLSSALNEPESVESEKNFDNARTKKIREDFNEFRDRFLKPKIKEVRRNLYEIENKTDLFSPKNKKDWKKSFWIRKKSFYP